MLSRVDHEMNLFWADQNPELFVKAVRKFQDEYANHEWDISIHLDLKNYVTLTAKRRFRD